MTGPQLPGATARDLAGRLIWIIAGAGLLIRLAPLLLPDGFYTYRVNYDEGVYFSAATLLAGGVVPYRDFVLVHPPAFSLLLAPIAALAQALDPAVVFGLTRVLAALVGATNVVLAGRLGMQHFGPLAGVAAALLYATHPETVREERGPMLEPVLNLACLAFAWLWLRAATSNRPLRDACLAGIAGGIAVAIKLWGGIWIAAALVVLPAPERLRRFVALSLGVGVGLAATFSPFVVVDPGAVLEQVLLFQLNRPPQGVGDPFLRAGHILVVTALAALTIPLVAIQWRTVPAAARFLAVTYVVVAVSFLAAPVYFPRYTSHLAAPAAILGGFAVSTLHERWRDRRLLGRAPVATLVTIATFQLGYAGWNTFHYRAPEQRDLAAAIRTKVPADACLFSMEPGWAILGGRLPEPRAGSPLVVDAHATRLLHAARYRGSGTEEPASPVARVIDACDYLVVGNWGLSRAQRDELSKAWIRLHTRATPSGPELWVRATRYPLPPTRYAHHPPRSSSSAMAPASYIVRSAAMIPRTSTLTARATSSVKMNRLGSDSMFPSKISPTTCAFRSITGLPEFPPMMSLVETKLSGVDRSSRSRRSNQRRGSSKGGLLSNEADRP
jgi:hypothetical protein